MADTVENGSLVAASLLSWGGIAEGLGSGVLSYIGGAAFQQALGIPTLEGVVGAAAADLKQFIVRIEEANFLDQCNRRVQGLYSLLHQYHNAPATSEHRLNTIDTESNELMFLLAGRGLESFPIFVMAVTLRIAALYTRYERYKDPGELINLKSLLGLSDPTLLGSLTELRRIVNVSVSEIQEGPIHEIVLVGYIAMCMYTVGGAARVIHAPPRKSREQARQEALNLAKASRDADLAQIQNVITQAETAFGEPGDRVRSIWDQIGTKLPS